ncbi:EF-hand domain-containing protein [Phenylobacterium sp.]|uniref:EF-hand domain-containing protein n=1 Tax=Phenylobacterium sp. TaxID=1871053 RepID=UPI0028987FB4|nr:EF-hand domain-containing protein [Phenylobacterium sp.]
MRLTSLILAAAALAGSTGMALAAEGRFIHPADTSKDDRIDKAEWVAYKLPEAEFAKADKDKNGLIDGPEFVAWDTAYKAAHQGH